MRTPKFTLEGCAPPHTLAEKLSYMKRVLEICVKFQLSSYNSLRDTRGSQIYSGMRCAPTRPLAKKFAFLKSALDLSECV